MESNPPRSSANRRGGVIAWMAKDKITPNLLMLLLIFGGLFITWNIKKEIMPEFESDSVTVSVSYSGASPEEIDLGVILPIENAINAVAGIDEINSTTVTGRATVRISLLDGEDPNLLLQEIDQEVSRISNLPDEAEKPMVTLASRKRNVMELMFYGDVDKTVLRAVTEQVRDRLLQDENLTQVELKNEPDHEIEINVNPDHLRRYDLTLSDIARVIGNSAFDQTSGEINSSSGDISIRVQERREKVSEFLNIPVKSLSDGSEILLRDIASVKEGLDDDGREFRYDGQLSSAITIYRIGEQTPIGVSDSVHNLLPEIEAGLPPGIQMAITEDDSSDYRNQMNLLLENAFIGLLLVLVLLSIVLEYRLAFWVTMGIPTSFLGAMLLLPEMGVSLNIISMFAFIIALGIVVDDAIIAGENIYHRRQNGMGAMKAAILGAQEVAVPLTFSILTNMIAFLPILSLPGFLGKLFQPTPLVVISVFAISWIEALFILPAHLGQMKDKPKGKMGQQLDNIQRFSDAKLQSFINNYYLPAIKNILNYRYLALALAICVGVFVGAWQASGRLGFFLMPRSDASFVMATAVLPYGSPDSKIQSVLSSLEQGVRTVVSENGNEQLSTGYESRMIDDELRVTVYLTDSTTRPITTSEFTNKWRSAVGPLSGLVSIKYNSSGHGPGGGPALTVELAHSNTQILQQASEYLALQLQQYSGASDISSSLTSGKPQLDVRITEEGLASGLTASSISSQLRSALFGVSALSQQEGRNEITVNVQLDEMYRQSETDLKNIMIRTPDGSFTPLYKVAEISNSIAPSTVTRRDGNRTVDITAEINPRGTTPQIVASLRANTFEQMKANFPGLQISLGGDQKRVEKSIEPLLTSSLLALLLIYALLAIPFQSFVQPLLVTAAIPFGIIGAIIGHMILGETLSMISILGVIALCGVVVNDSLMLIDTYNKNRQDMSWKQAITESAVRRFRPIILTTMTTFGGLAPMIFESSSAAGIVKPMAISLGFGIVFATVITLVIIPCMVGVGNDILKLFKGSNSTNDAALT